MTPTRRSRTHMIAPWFLTQGRSRTLETKVANWFYQTDHEHRFQTYSLPLLIWYLITFVKNLMSFTLSRIILRYTRRFWNSLKTLISHDDKKLLLLGSHHLNKYENNNKYHHSSIHSLNCYTTYSDRSSDTPELLRTSFWVPYLQVHSLYY